MSDRFVYFLLSPVRREVKIGFSASPDKRLNSYKTAVPDGVVLGVIEENDVYTERSIHEFLKDYRLYGEWFTAVEYVMRVITSITGGTDTIMRDDKIRKTLFDNACTRANTILELKVKEKREEFKGKFKINCEEYLDGFARIYRAMVLEDVGTLELVAECTIESLRESQSNFGWYKKWAIFLKKEIDNTASNVLLSQEVSANIDNIVKLFEDNYEIGKIKE